MALSRNDEQLLELLLKEREESSIQRRSKPMHIRVLQFSIVFLSLVLFIAVGALGILALSKPESAAAANTYSETWTATNGIYAANNGGALSTATGIPPNGTTEGTTTGSNGWFTVTAWTVTGTVN